MPIPKKVIRVFLVICLLCIVGVGVFFGGYRLNLSTSCARGIWKVSKKFDAKTDKGKMVLYYPPNTAYFKDCIKKRYLGESFLGNKISPLGKTVVGVPGDIVHITDEWVQINDQKMRNSSRLLTDSRGYPMISEVNNGSFVIPQGKAWLMALKKSSFDSRYFGMVDVLNIGRVIKPIMVWDDE